MAYHRHMAIIRSSKQFDAGTVRDAVLRVLPETEALYAFGSCARGDARPDSDLDLAVLTATTLDPVRRFEAQRELSVMFDRDVDLIDLRNASSVLRSEVVNGGLPLFRRDAHRMLDFEARVLGEYADLLDATRALREDIQQRGSVHT